MFVAVIRAPAGVSRADRGELYVFYKTCGAAHHEFAEKRHNSPEFYSPAAPPGTPPPP